MVSAAAFSLAPYLVYIDPHARGDSPETFALALAPWMFWAFGRVRRTAAPAESALAAVLLAAVILSHNLMALIFFALLLAWLAWEVLFGQTSLAAPEKDAAGSSAARRNRVILLQGSAVALGLLLAAFMWLPAVAERDAVQFRNVASGTYFDFRQYFLDVRELFGPALFFDLGATQMRFNYSVGLAQSVLGLLGLLTIFWPPARRPSVLFFAFVAIILMYFMLPASLQVWEALPPLAYLQFPTRLLGPAALALAMLAGASVSWTKPLPWRWSPVAYGAAAVALCAATILPLLYPPAWPEFGPVSAQRILETELNGRGIGTTSANDFLPVDVMVVPQPQASLIESYANGAVDKVNRATLPPDTQATILEHGPQRDRFRVTGPTDFVFRVYTFDFPGWTAYVDGQPAPISPSEPEGWITFWVPAGDHEVLLRLEDTPVRRIGWGLSGLAVLGLLALAAWQRRLVRPQIPVEHLGWRPALVIAAVALGALGLRYAADQAGWWRVHSTGSEVLVAQHQRYAALENNLALLAYDLPAISARPGDKVPVTLYWKASAPVTVNLRVFIHFIGPDGQLWGQSDKWNPADFPTSRFPLDRYVRDEHEAELRPDAPPGEYRIIAGLWEGETGQRMHVLDEHHQVTEIDGVELTDSFRVTAGP